MTMAFGGPSARKLQEMVPALVLAVLVLCTAVAGACPVSCSCQITALGQRAECRGGYLQNIFGSADSELRDIHVVTPDPHQELKAGDFDRLATIPLQNLTLRYGAIRVVKNGAFEKLEALQKLDLAFNSLYQLEPRAFQGLTRLRQLSLANNRITSLDNVLTSLFALEELDLSHNALSDLMTGSFRSQSRLWHLKLDGNRLQSLHGYVFQGLQNLRVLSLRHCDLLHITSNMFSVIRSLSKLDLGQNKISRLPGSQDFRNIPSLRELYLDNNEITSLGDSQFSGITLDTLDLSHNRITQINQATFSFFNVRHLDLSYNMIYTVAESFLRPTAPQLEDLDLANNPLREIPLKAFEGLYRLAALNVSSCSLEELEAQLFQDVPTLRTLDLSRNHLQNLPAAMLEDFNQLDFLSMAKNFWHCDCHIRPMYEWLQGEASARVLGCNGRGSQQCSRLRCTTPAHLLDVGIVELDSKTLTDCQVEVPTGQLPGGIQAAIVVACLVFAIILLVITACLWKRGRTHKGLKAVCIRENASCEEEEHMRKVRPFQDVDSRSLNESDKSYVFKKYFKTMVPGAGLTGGAGSVSYAQTSQRDVDSMYSSQPSLYSTESLTLGIESTV